VTQTRVRIPLATTVGRVSRRFALDELFQAQSAAEVAVPLPAGSDRLEVDVVGVHLP
jgi:hypothetical protein